MKTKLAVAVIALGLSSPAIAAFTIAVTENSGNVVASGSGSINTTGLPLTNSASWAIVGGSNALLFIGGSTTPANTAVGVSAIGSITGPQTFGTLPNIDADAVSGGIVGVAGVSSRLLVPSGYVSGDPLTSSATWNGHTIASLGLTPGTYEWTWGSGPTADKFTVQIGPLAAPAATTSIPTLSEWGLIGLSSILAMFGLSRMRRRQR